MKIFIVYPSALKQISNTIKESTNAIRKVKGELEIETWEQLDIPGRFIVEGVTKKIEECDILVADITRLNFNVIYEIGYAIGKDKRVFLILNEGLMPPKQEIDALGIFDTLGHKSYQNSSDVEDILRKIKETRPLRFDQFEIDTTAPIYVLDTLYKSNESVRIISKIKKSRIKFRSFDPQEQPRLSTLEAYKNVKKSLAIVINLLSWNSTDYQLNNYRGAFLAGLSNGLERETLIFQEGNEPVPLDYRDLVKQYFQPDDIDPHIIALVPKVMEGLQEKKGIKRDIIVGVLNNLELGSPAAENEINTLGQYYVTTEEYNRVIRGDARLAVGRKGSGKSALFFQVRDKLRANKSNIIVDLKPEGYQLTKFKSLVLRLLESSVQEHIITAFWEYILLLEIAYKVLEKDQKTYLHNHEIMEHYINLQTVYKKELLYEGGDFSERLLRLIERISSEFNDQYGGDSKLFLESKQITDLLYRHDIYELRKKLIAYLHHKNVGFLLIDNIDKGWPTRGVEATDAIILRSLLEASRKIEKAFRANEIIFHTTIFIRNDVYELLIEDSPDRGKESKVSLDWTDIDLLKEFIRRRFVYNAFLPNMTFAEVWNNVFVSHIEGEDSADYIINRSLMRPRNLLNLINYCKSSAVNLQHDKIDEDDVKKGFKNYSADLGNEISLEIRDVFPLAENVLYKFINYAKTLSLYEIITILEDTTIPKDSINKLIEILLWFGFFGLRLKDGIEVKEVFIYDVFYDMKKLKMLGNDLNKETTEFVIHKAFWPFLDVT